MTKKIYLARQLRKNMTDAEIILWHALRCKQIEGCRFRKQAPMGEFIVDFVCHQARLIVEVDGGQHNENEEYDTLRSKWLESRGYMVKRFWNDEVLGKLDEVMEVIFEICMERVGGG